MSPAACRLVELDGKPLERGVEPDTRVAAFAVLPRTGPELEAKLRSLRGRVASVVIWGAGADHRQVVVNNGAYDRMRREAVKAARDAGVETDGRMADIAPAATRVEGASRQPVVLALASKQAVSTALQPLLTAGINVDSVATPADALTSLARSRQAFAAPGGIDAYVALEETVTCIALVRDGALVAARELPWGYGASPAGGGEPAARGEDTAARLADALTEFVADLGASPKAVTQVSICGSLPNLRTMTVPLMERLDIEVEALDSLFGIDADRLPEDGNQFRERAAELRLAWAAGAAGRGPIDLMRDARQRKARAMFARVAVVAGLAAGLAVGLFVERSSWWRVSRPTSAAVVAPIKVVPVPVPAPVPAAVAVKLEPAKPVATIEPPKPPPQQPSTVEPPVVIAIARPVPLAAPPVVTPPVARPAPVRSVARAQPKPAVDVPPAPFDASLGSILYSPDRRLAIVDGRILGLGDEVKGALIVDITPTTVLLRDAQGRLRSLTLGDSGR